jgi:hypothetical protein
VNAEAVEITDPPPTVTVYGLQGTDEVYLAEGGEVLPAGAWMDNLESGTYTITMLKKTLVTFDTEASVYIHEAVDTQYMAPNGAWQMVSGAGTIQALEIRTGSSGSCTLSSNVRYEIGGEGGDWG